MILDTSNFEGTKKKVRDVDSLIYWEIDFKIKSKT